MWSGSRLTSWCAQLPTASHPRVVSVREHARETALVRDVVVELDRLEQQPELMLLEFSESNCLEVAWKSS